MAQRITINPNIMCGKPVIKGTRIPVYLILNLLEAGYTFERIIKAYPELNKEDIKAALKYAQILTSESVNKNLEWLLKTKILEKKEFQNTLMIIEEGRIKVRRKL